MKNLNLFNQNGMRALMRVVALFAVLGFSVAPAFAANCDALNGIWKIVKQSKVIYIDVTKGVYIEEGVPSKVSCAANNQLQFGGDITRQYTFSSDGKRAKVIYKSLTSNFTTDDSDIEKATLDSFENSNFTTYTSPDGCKFKLANLMTKYEKFESIKLENARCNNGYIDGLVALIFHTDDYNFQVLGTMVHGILDGTYSKASINKKTGYKSSSSSTEIVGGCQYLDSCRPIDLSQYKIASSDKNNNSITANELPDDPLVFGASASPRTAKAKGKKKK